MPTPISRVPLEEKMGGWGTVIVHAGTVQVRLDYVQMWHTMIRFSGRDRCEGPIPRPPHVQPPPRVHGSPPPRGEPSPSDGSPPGGGGTVHHSRPANSSITQLKIFFGAFGARDFLLISYCSWAK